MRCLYFASLFVATACTHRGSIPADSHSSDLDVYKAVIDSMFVPRAASVVTRLAILDSTEVFKRENSTALVHSLLKLPEVDSAMALDLAARSYERRSLKGLTTVRLRMPLLLLDRRALASLPREDPDKYWREYYQRFPGVSGIIELSAIGYSADGSAGVLMVDTGCGSLCGNGYIVVVKRDRGLWRLARIQNTWVS
jgi:hypothetical protein